jgi:phosphoglycerate dehydrogenase-like enzyme
MTDSIYSIMNHPSILAFRACETDDLTLQECWGNIEILVTLGARAETVSYVLAHNPVKWIHSMFVGVDRLLSPELLESDVQLTCARGCYNVPLVEYSLASLLYFNKQFDRLNANKHTRLWDRYNFLGISGKRLGVLGYGSIGKDVAKAAKLGLGMQIVAIKRTDTGPQEYADECHLYSSLNEVLPTLDFLVMVLPSTAETADLIGEPQIRLMKPTAVLVNIGRGDSLDEVALSTALHEGRLLGAALDVFKTEPLPEDHFLWRTPRLLISPHNADLIQGQHINAYRGFEQNLVQYLAGEPLLTPVNRLAKY